jgi:predicted SAM-dependent methyltransferase
MPSMILVDLGCGRVWHPAWLNYDLRPRAPQVRKLDLRRPLPLADRHADAVYHSHVLEHLPRATADRLLRECHRVLKPGGILRVAVPDLEDNARSYLQALEAAAQGGGDAGAARPH